MALVHFSKQSLANALTPPCFLCLAPPAVCSWACDLVGGGVARRGVRLQRIGKRVSMVRSVVREVAGLMPYEKRILDMIKVGTLVRTVLSFCDPSYGRRRCPLCSLYDKSSCIQAKTRSIHH
jgi:Ribosomal protein L36e